MVQNRFFLSLPVKKVNNNKFSSQIFLTSSQNNVQNYRTIGHKQVLDYQVDYSTKDNSNNLILVMGSIVFMNTFPDSRQKLGA